MQLCYGSMFYVTWITSFNVNIWKIHSPSYLLARWNVHRKRISGAVIKTRHLVNFFLTHLWAVKRHRVLPAPNIQSEVKLYNCSNNSAVKTFTELPQTLYLLLKSLDKYWMKFLIARHGKGKQTHFRITFSPQRYIRWHGGMLIEVDF